MADVRMLMEVHKPEIMLIQETKIEDTSLQSIRDLWRHPWKFIQIPSIGLSGGQIIAWNSDLVKVIDSVEGAFSISVVVAMKDNG
ncbi:hypothetical protein FRX31_018934, partial [Thalictrum thalictroides]